MQLENIKKSLQPDVIASYWGMLRELEVIADNENNPLLKVTVEGYYRLWNSVTNDNKQPRWNNI